MFCVLGEAFNRRVGPRGTATERNVNTRMDVEWSSNDASNERKQWEKGVSGVDHDGEQGEERTRWASEGEKVYKDGKEGGGGGPDWD